MAKTLRSKIHANPPQNVREVRWTNVDDLKKEIKQNTPFVLKGLIETWNAQHWSFNYFEKQYGDTIVNIQTKEELTLKDEPVKNENKVYSFRDYLKALKENQPDLGYLSQTQVQDIHSDLLNDFNFPKVFHHPHLSIINLWIGPRGTKSKLHYDSDFNLFAQLEGTKKVTLISPQESNYCYPVNRTWYDTYSPIDVEKPDFSLYPLFQHVCLYQVHIHPRDVLFIPKKWWHDIRSLSNSISLNLWWITWNMFFQELISETSYHLKSVLLRSNLEKVDRKNSYVQRLRKNILK